MSEWSGRELAELRYIGTHGPLFQRVPLNADPELMEYIHKGVVEYDGRGYRLTDEGRVVAKLAPSHCPTCGQVIAPSPPTIEGD